jgi:hypothetical protein
MKLHRLFNETDQTRHPAHLRVCDVGLFPVSGHPGSHRALAITASHPVVIDAVPLHAPLFGPVRYQVPRRHPALTRGMRNALLPHEKVLAQPRFHFIYSAYTLFFMGLMLCVAHPFGAYALGASQDLHSAVLAYGVGITDIHEQWAALLKPFGLEGLAGLISLSGADGMGWLVNTFGYNNLLTFLRDPLWGTLPAFLWYLLAALYLAWRLAKKWTTEIVLTDQRLLFRKGIVFMRTQEAELGQLDQIDVNQTWLGDLLDYGAVHVRTHAWENRGGDTQEHVATREIFLPQIGHPQRFSMMIENAKRRCRAAAHKPDHPAPVAFAGS